MSHSKHNAVSSRSWAAFTAVAIGLSATLVTLGGDSRWAWGQSVPQSPASSENETDQRGTNNGTPPNSCNYRVETALPMFGTATVPNANGGGDHCSSPEALIRYACSSSMRTTINNDVGTRTTAWINATNAGPAPSVPSAESARDVYYHNRSVARIRRLLGQPANGRSGTRPQAIQGITPLGHLRQQFLDLQASMTQHVEQLRQSTAPTTGGDQQRDHNATFARLKQMIGELQFPNDRDYADQAARHCIGAQANVAFIRRFENGRVRQTVVPCPGVLLMGNAPAALGFMAMAMGKTIDTCALDGTFLNPRVRSRSNDAQQPLSMRPLLQSLRTCTARRFLPGAANPTAQTHVLPTIASVPFGAVGSTGANTTDPMRVNPNHNPQRPHCGPCLNSNLVNGPTSNSTPQYDHSNEAFGVFLATKAIEGSRWQPGATWPGTPYLRTDEVSINSENALRSSLQFLCTDRPATGAPHRMAAIDRARIVLESSRVFRHEILNCRDTGPMQPTYLRIRGPSSRRNSLNTARTIPASESLPAGCTMTPNSLTLTATPGTNPSATNTPATSPPSGPAPTSEGQAPVPTPVVTPRVEATPVQHEGAQQGAPGTGTQTPTTEPQGRVTPQGSADGETGLTTFANATAERLTTRREAIEAAIRAQNPACQTLASRFTVPDSVFESRCRAPNNGRFDLDLRTENPQTFPASVTQGQYTVEIGCQMRCMCGDKRCWSPEATYRGQTQPALATANRFPTAGPALAAAINNDQTYYEFQQPNNGRFSLVAKACLRGVAGPETLSRTACNGTASATAAQQENHTYYSAGPERTISLLGETSGQILDYNCTVRCACSGEGTSLAATTPPQCLAFYTRGETRAIDDASRTSLTHNAENTTAVVFTAPPPATPPATTPVPLTVATNPDEGAGHIPNGIYFLRMPAGQANTTSDPTAAPPPAAPVASPAVAPAGASASGANPIRPNELVEAQASPLSFFMPNTEQAASQACQSYANRTNNQIIALLEFQRLHPAQLPGWFGGDTTRTRAWNNLINGITINATTQPLDLICKNNTLQTNDIDALLGTSNEVPLVTQINGSTAVRACHLNCPTGTPPRLLTGILDENPMDAPIEAAQTNTLFQHYCRKQAHAILIADASDSNPNRPFPCSTIENLPANQRQFQVTIPASVRTLAPTAPTTITCRLKPFNDTNPNAIRCLQLDVTNPEPEFEVVFPSATNEVSGAAPVTPAAPATTTSTAPVTPTAVATAATPATPAPNPSVTAPPSPAPVAAASATPAAGPTPTRAPAAAPQAPASPTSGTTAATPPQPPTQIVTAPQLTTPRAAAPTPPPAVTTSPPAARPAAQPVVAANPAPAASSPPAPVAITLPDIAVDTQPYRHQPYNDPSITIQLPTPNQLIDTCNNLTENNQRDVIALLHYYRTHNNTPPNWLREGRLAAWQELVRRRPITPQTGEAEFMCSADNNQLNAEPLARLLNRAVHQIPILAQQTTPSLTTTAYLCTQTCTVSITAGTTNTAALRSDVTANTTQPTLNAQTDNRASLHLLQHLCQQTAYERWVPAGSRSTLTCGGLAKAMTTNGDTNTTPFEMTLSPPAREAIAVLKDNNNRVFCHLNTNNYDPSTGVPDRTNRRPRCLDAASNGGGSIRPEFYVSIRTESAARPPAR